MGDFQKQERVWTRALEQGQLLALTNFGLCPFLFWWHRLPSVPLYGIAVLLLTISSLAFLYHFNYLLQRLAAMLPDETLRHETRVFGSFNRVLILLVPLLFIAYLATLRDRYRDFTPYHLVAAYNLGPTRMDELLSRKSFKPVTTKKYYEDIRRGVQVFRFYTSNRVLPAKL